MKLRSYITVRHNAEIAHRLLNLPGKCMNIHGHSLQIELALFGQLDENGLLAGLDFASVKKGFREYIDHELDHKLHMNVDDPWASPVKMRNWQTGEFDSMYLPGLVIHPGDPTTENIAKWICEWAWEQWTGLDSMAIEIQETGTNSAAYQIYAEEHNAGQ